MYIFQGKSEHILTLTPNQVSIKIVHYKISVCFNFMGSKDAEEFRNALIDIASHIIKLDSPFGNRLYSYFVIYLMRK